MNALSARAALGAFSLCAAVLLVLLGCASNSSPHDTPPARVANSAPPNIVIVFADDLGYGDLSCYGSTLCSTPHLDRLAAEGVRFTDFYAAQPVCSASRAALLTGCYPNRLGIHGALGPSAKHGLAPEVTTIAELCKGRGYATGAFGKWHLGHLPEFLPLQQGFDQFYGIPYSNDMWPFHPENPKAWGDLPTIEGNEPIGYNTDQSRFTTDFTQRTTGFIRRAVRRGEPFFAYLAHPMPHVPLFVSAERAGATGRGLFADVIAEVDWSVGQVMATLSELGVADNTLVIFASDNGPWLSYGNHAGSTGPLREGKGTTFDGGIRVPMIARYPGVIPAGSVQSEPAMAIDILPTIASIIGDTALNGAPDQPPIGPVDGKDITALLTCQPNAKNPHDAYFFYYHTNHLEAVRSGRWKLHLPHKYRTMKQRTPGADGIPGKYDYAATIELSLFDLQSDIGETTDVKDQHPQILARLLALAETARTDLGDALTNRPGVTNYSK